MKLQLKINDYRVKEEDIRETDLASLLKRHISDKSYDGEESGKLETLESRISRTADFVFELVDMLAKKGIIDPVEVLDRVVAPWGQGEDNILIDGKTLAEIRKERRKTDEDDY